MMPARWGRYTRVASPLARPSILLKVHFKYLCLELSNVLVAVGQTDAFYIAVRPMFIGGTISLALILKYKPETRYTARLAFGVRVTAMQRHDRLHDCQSKAGSALGARTTGIGSIETLKHMG